MRINRSGADNERLGNLLIAVAAGNQFQHLDLSLGQGVCGGRRTGWSRNFLQQLLGDFWM